jgi:hypothetical protein
MVVVVVVELVEGELLHPASPRREAPSTTSDHLRAEDMRGIPFQTETRSHPTFRLQTKKVLRETGR